MSYEQLMGALGRGMFFRPQRRRLRDLISSDAEARVRIGDGEYPMFDVSMGGLSFLSKGASSQWVVGEQLDVSVVLHGGRAHAGTARVARVEASVRGCRVGLELLSGFLDPLELRRRDEVARFDSALDSGAARIRSDIPSAYSDCVGRIAFFVQYYRRALERREAVMRQDGASERELDECARRVCDMLRAPWLRLCADASRAAVECMDNGRTLQAAKDYTEAMVTSLLLDAPMCSRSYKKPLGYPGDYQVMLYYYANSFEGSSVFAKVFHKFFVEHPLSNGVRTRSQYVVDLIVDEMERTRLAGVPLPCRVTSLGCGPAKEIPALVEDPRRGDSTSWTLIDQEEEALAAAYRSARSAIAGRNREDSLRCLNVSFAQLLLEPSLMPIEDKQHVIFSTGLFDYLRESRAQALVAGLYNWLEPGGLLVIGNALGPNEHFWSPEFVLDWTLLYRTRADMMALARDLPDTAQVEVTVEPGGAYYFLLVRRG